jgi:hypothetical protein
MFGQTQQINSDLSGLVGGQLPSGSGKALQLDAFGNLQTTGGGGGGGGAVTAAAGAYADGALVTMGLKGDAAVTNPALSASEIALLKGLVTLLAGTLTVTANAGTNLNTSQLAVESGGNLAAILADTADIETNTSNIPPVGQAAMAASTPVVIASNQSNVPISGTITANAGTNLNTSALAVESGGHLASLDTHLPSPGQAAMAASVPVVIASNQTAVPVSGTVTTSPPANASTNLTQVNGTALSSSNGVPVLQTIQQFILDGKAYTCSTGKITAAANQAMSWFSANTSTKNKIVFSIRMTYGNSTQSIQRSYLTTDDANITAGTSCISNALNLKGGGSGPEAATAMHYNSGVATVAGTFVELDSNPTNNIIELLAPGTYISIPAGTAGGVGVYQSTTAAGSWAVTVIWVEF